MRATHDEVTVSSRIKKINFWTESSDGFTGAFYVLENGEHAADEYRCIDCKDDDKPNKCLGLVDVDSTRDNGGDNLADCVKNCTFVLQGNILI